MKIGFIGLGAMGWPMAANLARAGHQLFVFDVDAERTRAFADQQGAVAMEALARDWDVEAMITMLPTGRIVRTVLLEDGPRLARGTLVIDMSSSEPTGTRELGAALAESGVVLIDAPVSGGVPRATDGGLTIMIGGDDPAAIERARPVLSILGERLFETGGLGSGHAMKALNNYVTAATFIATSEAVIAGRRFGLDPAAMIEIMNVSTGRTFHSEITMKHHVINGKFATGFALALAAKDVNIAADLTQAVSYDAPMCRLTRDRMAVACGELEPGSDISAAFKTWDKSL